MRRFRANENGIRAILHDVWNPIGFPVPADEYDDYVWPVHALLIRKAGRREVESCLRDIADGRIGVAAREADLQCAVDKLIALEVGG